jgi:hypothetical protein
MPELCLENLTCDIAKLKAALDVARKALKDCAKDDGLAFGYANTALTAIDAILGEVKPA